MVEKIVRCKKTVPDYQEMFATFDGDLSQFKRVKGTLFQTYRDICFDFNLFCFILTLDCFYCDGKPSNKTRCKNGDVIMTNGLDRINQNEGHTLGNIVSCCKQCNWSKTKRSSFEFIAWAERVLSFRDR
jgi:hypothetical protein